LKRTESLKTRARPRRRPGPRRTRRSSHDSRRSGRPLDVEGDDAAEGRLASQSRALT
jgi:hypothetical protein